MKRKFIKNIYRYIFYLLAIALKLVVQYLPRGFALQLGKVSGYLCFKLMPKERRRTLGHLQMVFDKKDARKIARGVFIHLGMNFMEWLQMPRLNSRSLDTCFRATGLERINKALSKGKGGIILTAHFGNWEYLGAYLTLKGYEGPVIGRRIYYKPYDVLLRKMRSSVGVLTLDRNGSVRRMIKVLKENKLLGILPDQDTDKVEGIFIDFFGFPAYTPTGPVSLAMATGASIIPCFIVRENKGHHIYVEEPLQLVNTGDKTESIRINTQRWSKVIEKYIRMYPQQWVWMHRRWQTRDQRSKTKN